MSKEGTATAEADEFADNALESDESQGDETNKDTFEAYAKAGKLGDADDAPLRKIIDEDTKVKLGIVGFQLMTKGSPRIAMKLEVVEPQEFTGDETNFRASFWLNATPKEGSDRAGWHITKDQISRVVAAVFEKPLKDPAVINFLDPAFLAVENVTGQRKREKFFAALLTLLTDELKGKTFETDIGVKAAEKVGNKKYPKQQTLGRPYYPGRRERKNDD